MAGCRLRQRVRQARKVDRHLPADDSGHRRRPALVGYVHHLQTGALEKHDHRQVAIGGDAAGGVGDCLWPLANIGNKLGQGLDRQARMHGQSGRTGRDEADRREILHRVVARVQDRRHDGDNRQAAHEQRIAVGRRACRRLSADRATRASPVLDDELLSEHLAEALPNDPGDAVGNSARRIGHDDPDRPLRPRLRLGGRDRTQRDQAGKQCEKQSSRWHDRVCRCFGAGRHPDGRGQFAAGRTTALSRRSAGRLEQRWQPDSSFCRYRIRQARSAEQPDQPTTEGCCCSSASFTVAGAAGNCNTVAR